MCCVLGGHVVHLGSSSSFSAAWLCRINHCHHRSYLGLGLRLFENWSARPRSGSVTGHAAIPKWLLNPYCASTRDLE